MLGTLALLTLAATPLKLGAPGFSWANVDEGVAKVASDHFARQLSQRGIDVVTAAEMAQLLGMERQRELLGCADSGTSCLAELTQALGVDAVVTGSLGRFGQRFTVNIKVTRAKDGASLAVFSTEVGSEEELPAALSRGAADVADQLRPRATLPMKHRIGMGVGYGLSAALIVSGVICFALAASARNELVAPGSMLDPPQAFALRNAGELRQVLGGVFLGVGVVGALITGVVFMALGESASVGAP